MGLCGGGEWGLGVLRGGVFVSKSVLLANCGGFAAFFA